MDMEEENKIIIQRYIEMARLCSVLSTPSRIALLEKLAENGEAINNDFIELDGMSRYTVGMNLKYFKKMDLITGTLSSKKLAYSLNLKKIGELKKMFDEFYFIVNPNRD